MGIIKRGLLGGFSGKVANIVGSSWKGIAVMKSLPLSVANPRTAGQVAQRNKFSGVVSWASILLASICKPLWDRFAQQQSGYNAFVSANIDAFSPTGIPSAELIVISRGSLTGVEVTSATASAATDAITMIIQNNSAVGNASATDELYMVVYVQNSDTLVAKTDYTTRADVNIGFNLPFQINAGDIMIIYTAFRRVDGTMVSDSTMTQIVVGA